MALSIATAADLLRSAVTEPGTISAAYRQFHNYSIGNQLLAWSQCQERGIAPGPMATFLRWKELGRHVRKGAKALVLCMPVTVKRSPTDDEADLAETFTRFVYKPHWFVLAQTDGKQLAEGEVPTWDTARGMAALDVQEIAFDHMNGNCLGFVSLNEGIDATTPAGKLQMHILGAIAEFERARIVERVRAGIARARSQGKRLGRRPIWITDEQLASVAHLSQRHAAETLGIPRSVLQRARVARNPPSQPPTFAPNS